MDNYIEIQKMRYSFQLKYFLETSGSMEEYRIPPMLIYTFVENSVKYGLSEEFGEVIINVRVQIEQVEEKEFIDITIRDNGPGFSNEKLIQQLDSGEIILDSEGEEHYGIANVKHRLEIIYGTEALVGFCNYEQAGALIHIRIPSKIMDEQLLA